MSEGSGAEGPPARVAGTRSLGMLAVAALSLMVGAMGIAGSASMVTDGLGITRIAGVARAPEVGTSSAPPPAPGPDARVVVFGALRGVLSVLLVLGAVGTLGVRPAGRRYSLMFAVGWIVLGAIEPVALGYRFGWPVVVSAIYPFLLLLLFNAPAWRTAFAAAPPASPSAGGR